MTGKPAAKDITTKHPDYLRARKKLDQRYSELSMRDVSMLTGYAEGTVAEYARAGRFGARKDPSNRLARWEFDVNAVRLEIGLAPLPDAIG